MERKALISDRRLEVLARYAQAGLAAALVIQAAHVVEHVAQVVQKFVLGYTVAPGFLGSVFDLEWVHFTFNTALELALIVIFVWWRRSNLGRVPLILTAAVLFQGYHAFEHVVKMYQYYALGITVAPKGILGYIFPLIWLHFSLNLITLALMLGAWLKIRPREAQTMVPA